VDGVARREEVAGETSAELARFRDECLKLASGSANGGTFANKEGYHNTRTNLWNHTNAQGVHSWRDDYSMRQAVDREGPSDKCAAFDWTFRDAQGGAYGTIIKFMDRIEAAFNRKDPRLSGWREALGQADPDLQAEGFDFSNWGRRTPDDSHLWHIHFSIHRKYVNDRKRYDNMLSILRGESLAEWEGGGSMATIDSVYNLLHDGRRDGPSQTSGGGVPIAWIVRKVAEIQAAQNEQKLRQEAILAAVQDDSDVDAILAAVESKATQLAAEVNQVAGETVEALGEAPVPDLVQSLREVMPPEKWEEFKLAVAATEDPTEA
jgi:hypothetical protein